MATGLGGLLPAFGLGPADYAVRVNATASNEPPALHLTWVADPNALSYTIDRRPFASTSWQSMTTLTGTVTSYMDTDLTAGEANEYRIRKSANDGSTAYTGYGYLYAGIQAPLIETRGCVLLLVESTLAEDLAMELERLRQDLVGDGWRVMRRDVSRTGTVAEVKATILDAEAAEPGLITTLFLLGRIPVPHSGNLAPDGHSDHIGAWPADAYYADLNGNWTDTSVSNTSAANARNRNVPGDGKFDQSSLPGNVEWEVGRVDLSNMPAFGLPERELLRRYLNKNHRFRHGLVHANNQALIDDHFGAFSGEAFAQNGWRNFSALVGGTNTFARDWKSTLETNSHLWAYGAGSGWYTSAGGVAATSDFVNHDYRTVFTLLFGSYFGDWDSSGGTQTDNNFLRAPLASNGDALVCAWAGRPHWFLHHMGLGMHIGYSARLTQNNTGAQYPAAGLGARQVHVALMGDPTLRQVYLAPASNLVSDLVLEDGRIMGVSLAWQPTPDPALGYHVYRATSPDGAFDRLTPEPLPSTVFVDTNPPPGTVTYMVRAVALMTSPSGSYYDASQGRFTSILVDRHVTRYVATTGSNRWPYTSWQDAATGIQIALDAARDGDMIVVTGEYALASQVLVTNAVTLCGEPGSIAVVKAINSNRCFRVAHAGAVVDGFLIMGGSETNGGGAYLAAGALVNCVVVSNFARAAWIPVGHPALPRYPGYWAEGDGGGVYVAGAAQVNHCTLADNAAAMRAGGLFVAGAGSIRNTIIDFNTAESNANWQATGTAAFANCFTTPAPPGTGNSGTDPGLDAANAYRLLAQSPCIDAGMVEALPDRDLTGRPRPLDGNGDGQPIRDVGAHETLLATADSDFDGLTDAEELLADTSPIDPSSLLRFTAILANPQGVQLDWQGGSRALQQIESRTQLDPTAVWLPVFTNSPPTPTTNSIILPAPPGSNAFYRITIGP